MLWQDTYTLEMETQQFQSMCCTCQSKVADWRTFRSIYKHDAAVIKATAAAATCKARCTTGNHTGSVCRHSTAAINVEDLMQGQTCMEGCSSLGLLQLPPVAGFGQFLVVLLLQRLAVMLPVLIKDRSAPPLHQLSGDPPVSCKYALR